MKLDIRVQAQDFDLSAELLKLRDGNREIGAVASFIGIVRDVNEEKSVASMELEYYPGMTEKSIATIVEQAERRWPLIAATVIHRIGRLAPSDQIVLVAVAAAHRGEAFAACEFIMDYLKSRAPFWKKELTPDGEHWVDARESDARAMEKWET